MELFLKGHDLNIELFSHYHGLLYAGGSNREFPVQTMVNVCTFHVPVQRCVVTPDHGGQNFRVSRRYW